MIFGEFIYAEGAEKLHGSMSVMYWLYAFTFMFVIFFTLLNFFLAIIVDSFVDVKNELDHKYVTENIFWWDCYDTILSWIYYRKKGWPTRHKIILMLRRQMKR